MFVIRHSRPKIWLGFCLFLMLGLGALQFTRYAHVHFLLVMVVVTAMAFERLAFFELFAAQPRRIDALENAHRA